MTGALCCRLARRRAYSDAAWAWAFGVGIVGAQVAYPAAVQGKALVAIHGGEVTDEPVDGAASDTTHRCAFAARAGAVLNVPVDMAAMCGALEMYDAFTALSSLS